MTDETRPNEQQQSASAAAQAIFQLFQQWLTRVESKIDNLTGQLAGKADRSDVAALSERIDGKATKAEVVELRSKLERESDRIDAIDKTTGMQGQRASDQTAWTRWAFPVVLTIIYTGVSIYSTFIHH